VGYIPLFVSVKSHDDFTEAAAVIECHQLKRKAEAAEPEFGALCLLVIFGAERKVSDENLLDKSCVNQLCEGRCVEAVLRIPRNDRFGLSRVFASMTSDRDETTEILASHCFVGYENANANENAKLRASGNPQEKYARESLRKSRRKKTQEDAPLDMLTQLASDLQFESRK